MLLSSWRRKIGRRRIVCDYNDMDSAPSVSSCKVLPFPLAQKPGASQRMLLMFAANILNWAGTCVFQQEQSEDTESNHLLLSSWRRKIVGDVLFATITTWTLRPPFPHVTYYRFPSRKNREQANACC